MQQRDEIARAEFVDTGDGHRAYLAVPAGAGPFPGVLVFQEAFGIDPYMRNETERLARNGYAAIAPDLFDGQTYSYDDREGIGPRLSALTDELMLDHTKRAAAQLQNVATLKKGPLGAVGFCMGGRLAFLVAAAFGERVGAAACFYGGSIGSEQKRFFEPLLHRAPQISAELLLLYGADDPSIEPREHGRIAEALSTNKKQFTMTVFAGAGHGFASRDRKSLYNAYAAEIAWEETLRLFGRALK